VPASPETSQRCWFSSTNILRALNCRSPYCAATQPCGSEIGARQRRASQHHGFGTRLAQQGHGVLAVAAIVGDDDPVAERDGESPSLAETSRACGRVPRLDADFRAKECKHRDLAKLTRGFNRRVEFEDEPALRPRELIWRARRRHWRSRRGC